MKKLLRAILPESQYLQLAKFRRRLLIPPGLYPLVFTQRAIARRTLTVEQLLELKDALNLTERMDYARHDIFLHVDSHAEHSLRLHSCKKEPDTVEWIETFMRPGDVFYDIGANVGPYSLVAAKFFAGAVKTYAFEPAFLNFTQLCRNVFLNNCQESVIPLSVALSDETAIGAFNYHNLVPGGSLHTFGEAIDHKGQRFEPVLKQPVISYRTDDLIKQFGLPVPNHIKIDVDGIELAVLQGAEKTLADPSVRSLVVELEEGEHETQIGEYVAGKGFQLHSKHRRITPGMLNCLYWRATV